MSRFAFQLLAVLAAWLAVAPGAAPAQQRPSPMGGPPQADYAPPELKEVTVDEKPNQQLPLDAAFVDEMNRPVTLGQYFNQGRPVILQLGYYGCPMLCDLVSKGMVDSLREVDLVPGKDYDVVYVSIDPTEKFDLAQKKKRAYVQAYGRGGADTGWHFLTGKEAAIQRVADAVGFRYRWVASAGQYSHPAAIMIATPEGKVSRYLYGVRFKEQTLRLSLVEASAGKIGTTTDRFLLTCFQYDGKQGRYAMAAMTLMRLAGALTAVALGTTLFILYRREARRRAAQAHSEDDAPGATPHPV
jgi:protein SCO1/2